MGNGFLLLYALYDRNTRMQFQTQPTEVLPLTAPEFLAELNELISTQKISNKSRILFVNDGSKDSTWKLISALSEDDEHYIGISQSRNRGHQNAVLAGLMEAKNVADITISIDCDGQDDISAMTEMVEKSLVAQSVSRFPTRRGVSCYIRSYQPGLRPPVFSTFLNI